MSAAAKPPASRPLLFAILVLISARVVAGWEDAPDGKLQKHAADTVCEIRATIEHTHSYFDLARGYAVFPGITRIGIGLGGAYGKGIVVEGDTVVGTTSYKQFTFGIQIGARNFAMIIFFQDEAALAQYKEGGVQFMGQTGLSLLTTGVNATPSYNNGVAVFALPKLGLMGEFTVSGVKFNYKPLPNGD